MPNTPKVQFEFQNDNVQDMVPSLGISHVVARTTKGKFNTPDKLYSSYTKFQEDYGEEIVPDGSISNIKKALEFGSTLRISRVAGAEGVEFGHAKEVEIVDEEVVIGDEITLGFKIFDPNNIQNVITIAMGIQTKEAGSPVIDNSGFNLNRNFYLKLYKATGPNTKIYLSQYTYMDGKGELNTQLANNLLLSSGSIVNPYLEGQVLQDFINNVPNIELVFKSATVSGDLDTAIATRIHTMDDVIALFRTYSNWYGRVDVNGTVVNNSETLVINEGSNGGDSDVETWVEAYHALKGYNDGYQLILSHVHQHIKDYTAAYSRVATEVIAAHDIVLYVELPKYDADNQIQTPDMMLKALETLVPTVGMNKLIAYFGGGIKFYDDYGALRDCDVLGTVIGLGDNSATHYGPWYSFSGMNRGLVPTALGPVTKNLGGDGELDILQELAEWYLNLFVIKNTPAAGRKTMLWHGFTSNPTTSSDKFLSITRLNLYLKKNLKPILESYLEEPNSFATWNEIYYKGREIMDDLVDNQAISQYTWMGDQGASSYKDLVVNNEADVRQGKYKLIIKYKDIVPLQEVSVVIAIDSVTRDISFETQTE